MSGSGGSGEKPLVEFLLARITEDEAAAALASRGPWSVDSDTYAEYIGDADGQAVVSGSRWGGEASVFGDTDDALHIVRWNPARVLAECAAKRAIIAYAPVEPRKIKPEHRGAWLPSYADPNIIEKWVDDELVLRVTRERYERDIVEPWREPLILRTLAQPYADHADFNPDWLS